MDNDDVKIIAVGDMSFGDHYFSLGHGPRGTMEKSGAINVLSNIQKYLTQGDVVFGNLEGVISDVGKINKSFSSMAFRGSPDAINSLVGCGFNVVNIANNHILQHGLGAYKDTLARLNGNGIKTLGEKGCEGFYCKPVVIKQKGIKIGFLGYSAINDQYDPLQTFYSTVNEEHICNDIYKLKTDVDIVIVSLHFGVELTKKPGQKEINLSRRIIDFGAKIILGHHPHIFQKVEHYHGGLIIYSLGNFIFDLPWDRRMNESAILSVRINGDLSLSVKCEPVRIASNGYPSLVNFTEDDFSNASDFVDCVNYRNTTSLYSQDYDDPYLPENVRKLLYFFLNILKGSTWLKVKFIAWKMMLLFKNKEGHP